MPFQNGGKVMNFGIVGRKMIFFLKVALKLIEIDLQSSKYQEE